MSEKYDGWIAKDLKDNTFLLGSLSRRKDFVELHLSPGWENKFRIVKVKLVEVEG